jgi:hypothetical protein
MFREVSEVRSKEKGLNNVKAEKPEWLKAYVVNKNIDIDIPLVNKSIVASNEVNQQK